MPAPSSRRRAVKAHAAKSVLPAEKVRWPIEKVKLFARQSLRELRQKPEGIVEGLDRADALAAAGQKVRISPRQLLPADPRSGTTEARRVHVPSSRARRERCHER